MLEQIQKLLSEVEAFSCSSAEELEKFRIEYLGKKGKITALFADFKNVPNEQKKEVGQKINLLKNTTADKVEALN